MQGSRRTVLGGRNFRTLGWLFGGGGVVSIYGSIWPMAKVATALMGKAEKFLCQLSAGELVFATCIVASFLAKWLSHAATCLCQ